MTPIEIVLLLTLTGYGIYRQTQQHQVRRAGRFKMAIIYLIIGAVVGGFAVPGGFWGWVFLAISLALSAVVGLIRGYVTPVWQAPDGTIWSRGTALTVGLFVGLVVVKFGLGTVAYLRDVTENSGFGEILFMIGIMMAIQAQLVWKRAQTLTAERPTAPPAGVAAPDAAWSRR